jgi:phenylacetate-CoA ligase
MNDAPSFSPGLLDMLKIAWRAKALGRHERWTRDRMMAYQAKELSALREYAYENSPFYRSFHSGLEHCPLYQLPVLTKQQLMVSWNDVVTDRSLKLEDIERFLSGVTGLETYQDKYFAFATGGTTGVKGITVFSMDEFLNFFSLTARASGWTGTRLPLLERPRMAVVQSHLPWHAAGAAAFIKLPIVKTLVLDTVEPVERLVAKLNGFQPHVFGGYAGNVHLLAIEQLAGRLQITPRLVMSTAETLKKEARKAIAAAWGVQPFEAYGTTETAEAASECQEHRGLHIYEDAVILEVVDKENQPVPHGASGDKVLATVLWNRTLPLIRYEISDHVQLSVEPCPCGRPFQLIHEVQGREEQVIHLPGQSGQHVRIEPDLFFNSLVLLPVDGWQVVQEREDAITFLIQGPHADFGEAAFLQRMIKELVNRGAKPPILKVEYITEPRRTKIGKLITIEALKGERATWHRPPTEASMSGRL